MKNPEFVLKCPNRVTSLCTILKSINGFILAAQTDGYYTIIVIIHINNFYNATLNVKKKNYLIMSTKKPNIYINFTMLLFLNKNIN